MDLAVARLPPWRSSDCFVRLISSTIAMRALRFSPVRLRCFSSLASSFTSGLTSDDGAERGTREREREEGHAAKADD